MYTVKKKWLTGWTMLPCFTIKTMEGSRDADLTCGKVLEWLFTTFFAPFWDGGIHITGSYEE